MSLHVCTLFIALAVCFIHNWIRDAKCIVVYNIKTNYKHKNHGCEGLRADTCGILGLRYTVGVTVADKIQLKIFSLMFRENF